MKYTYPEKYIFPEKFDEVILTVTTGFTAITCSIPFF